MSTRGIRKFDRIRYEGDGNAVFGRVNIRKKIEKRLIERKKLECELLLIRYL